MGNPVLGFGGEPEIKALPIGDDCSETLRKVVQAVVMLTTTVTKTFDTDFANSSVDTGFVVDKKRGIILTNRHVVKPGPVVVEATFFSGEEISVSPIYMDPVHDFAFLRYDPDLAGYHEEITLVPEAASVGLEIKVVGNRNEKLAIQAGSLAYLDRDAPHYAQDGYNDFNTFYMQASAETPGGSSGSPVVDKQGRAVALNVAYVGSDPAKKTTAAYFLPLERVVRAFRFIQKSKKLPGNKWEAVTIPRGTLQSTFLHKSFADTSILGLDSETEKMVRHESPAGEIEMLVVESVVPGGPADKYLTQGDTLVRVNGKVITKFLKLESMLDNNVNQVIRLQIARGGVLSTVDLTVQDVHSITPNLFLEISGAVIQSLSYQQARNFHCECGLVYVADPGYMLSRANVPRHAIIKKFGGKDIFQLNDLMQVLSTLSIGEFVSLDYISYVDRLPSKSVWVTIDRNEWYAPPRIYTRDDSTGLWTGTPALPCGFSRGVATDEHAGEEPHSLDSQKKRLRGKFSVAELLQPTLVGVEVHVPPSCLVDGVHKQDTTGVGVIIYHSQRDNMGLVVVDKSTVAVSVSDVILSFAASKTNILGEVVFLHPVHNFALIAYDPSSLEDANASVCAAELLSEPALRQGDSVYFVSLDANLQATAIKTTVCDPCDVVDIVSAAFPRYRATNMEVIKLDEYGFIDKGILSDENGLVQAILGSFSNQIQVPSTVSTQVETDSFRGIPIYAVSEVLKKIILRHTRGPFQLINGIKRPMPLVRMLDVELYPIVLSEARSFKLSDSWIKALTKKDPVRRQVLRVKGCLAGSKACQLEKGDMILAINKDPITCFRDVEIACQRLDASGEGDSLKLTVLRQVKEIEVIVETDVRNGLGTTRMVNWCGSIFQDPHPAARALEFIPKEGHGVYGASCWYSGSPAHTYGLWGPLWIIQVNGKPTPDVESLVEVTKGLEDNKFVHVKVAHLNGKFEVLRLKQDLHYWPTWELKFVPEDSKWRRGVIKTLDSSIAA